LKAADGGTGETNLLSFDVATRNLRMEMADITKDMQRSKYIFLTSWQGKILITDLGMDCVYTLDLDTNGLAVCGKTGLEGVRPTKRWITPQRKPTYKFPGLKG
jgi:hypothetical protein